MIYITPAPRRDFTEQAVDAPKPFELRSELFRQQQQEWKSRPARPKLPCPLLPPFVTDVAQDPVVRVTDFFASPEEPYPIRLTRESHLIEDFQEEIDGMPPCFQEFPFSPHPCTDCPIHESLSGIAAKFVDSHKEISFEEKIALCEQFVNQFVSKIVHSFSDAPPVLGYQNNLKNREFGKEALQNFDADLATIAQRQGASEHPNSEAKPTQPKTDSSGCFGRKPLFACFEIALRAHLFNQLVKEEKSNFTEKLPSDLKEREDALDAFVTKNGFFISPDPFLHTLAPMHIFYPLMESCASKVSLDSLEMTLGQWKSGPESRTSQFIEDVLREYLNLTLISQQVKHFKGQFDETGAVSQDDFNLAASKISSVIMGKVGLSGLPCVKKQMLATIFGLCQENDFSFGWLYTQIKAEKAAQLALPKPVRYFPSFYATRCEKTCLRLDEKLKTLAWAEEEWKACCLAPPQSLLRAAPTPIHFEALPAKPLQPATESETLLQLYTSLPNKPLFYNYFYQEAVAAGVQIASWDLQFAEYNWNKENMISIAMRAAKRCLNLS